MNLLLDTHFVLALVDDAPPVAAGWAKEDLFVSVASLWEIAIKMRAGKLHLAVEPSRIEEALISWNCTILSILASHTVEEVTPWPTTNDPFDRLLLAVCSVEGLRLVTRDRYLVSHPLAWREGAA